MNQSSLDSSLVPGSKQAGRPLAAAACPPAVPLLLAITLSNRLAD